MQITREMVILALALLGFFLLFFVIHLILPKERFPYCARDILTKNEEQLYQVLYSVCARNGWMLLMKMRLADIIGVQKGTNDYMKYFNKIKAKHTDFVLCDPYTLEVLAGLELDDPSHNRPDRIERDAFVNKVYQAAGIPLIHVWNPITEEELEDVLMEYLIPIAVSDDNREKEIDNPPAEERETSEMMGDFVEDTILRDEK